MDLVMKIYAQKMDELKIAKELEDKVRKEMEKTNSSNWNSSKDNGNSSNGSSNQ